MDFAKLKTQIKHSNAGTRLWAALLTSGALYLAFTLPFLLSHYYATTPPVDYAKLTGYSTGWFAAYILGILALFGLYLTSLRALKSSGQNWEFVLISAGFFAGILIFSYPQTAIDMLVYALRTRGWALYGLSPFAVSPDAFPASDPWLGLAGEWADAASPYGPVWELLSLGLFRLMGGNYLTHLFALKMGSALAYLGSTGIIYIILRRIRPGWALQGMAFFAWNPLVLLESVQNAHNDIWMVFFLLIAIWAYLQLIEQPRHGTALIFIAAFSASILVKFITLLVLPIFLLGLALRQPSWMRRGGVMLLYAAGILLITAAMMAPYWPGLDHWAVLRASKGAGRSWVALLVLLAREGGVSSINQAFDDVNGAIYVIFGGIYLWGIWRVVCRGKVCFRGTATTLKAAREMPLRISFYLFFWYVLFVATVFHAWYLLWFLPLAALLIPEKRVLSGAVVFSLMALLIIPYYETVRVWLPYLNTNHIAGHLIGVALLTIPVLLSVWRPWTVLPHDEN